jgi:Uma2 family endonuclease
MGDACMAGSPVAAELWPLCGWYHDGMTAIGARITAEEFARLPEDPAGGRMELVNGEVVVAPPAGEEHGWIEKRLARRFDEAIEDAGLGLVFAESGYILRRSPDLVREPDVSIRRSSSRGVGRGYFEGTPDVAVEIVSPNDAAHDVQRKVGEYLAAGVTRVWTVWPETRSLTVHSPGGASHTYAETDVLRDDALGFEVPGFSLPVADIFPPLRSDTNETTPAN